MIAVQGPFTASQMTEWYQGSYLNNPDVLMVGHVSRLSLFSQCHQLDLHSHFRCGAILSLDMGSWTLLHCAADTP